MKMNDVLWHRTLPAIDLGIKCHSSDMLLIFIVLQNWPSRATLKFWHLERGDREEFCTCAPSLQARSTDRLVDSPQIGILRADGGKVARHVSGW